MANKDELKALLADKYDIKKEDIEDTTLISEIVGSDKKLGTYVKDKFDVELSTSDLENASNFADLANLL